MKKNTGLVDRLSGVVYLYIESFALLLPPYMQSRHLMYATVFLFVFSLCNVSRSGCKACMICGTQQHRGFLLSPLPSSTDTTNAHAHTCLQ